MELTASLTDTALALSEKDRAELAYKLLLSLKEHEPEAEVELAWAAEVKRRVDSAVREPSRLRDLDEALGEIEQLRLVRK